MTEFGFNDAPHVWTSQAAKRAKRAGSSVARLPLSPDVIAEQGFAPYDAVYKALRAKGIKPLFAIVGGRAGPEYNRAVRKIAKRYKGADFEIGNEPNIALGGDMPAKQYIRQLKQGEAAVHKVRPKAEVISAGLAPEGADSIKYAKKIARKTKNRDISIGAHLYPGTNKPLKQAMRQYYQYEKMAGDRDIYVTETGVSSAQVGAKRQAKLSAKLYEKLADRDAEGVIFHSLTPGDGGVAATDSNQSIQDWLRGLSVTNEQGKPKPVYRALRRAVRKQENGNSPPRRARRRRRHRSESSQARDRARPPRAQGGGNGGGRPR